MKTAIVTGSSGLVGSETARFYLMRGYRVVGIDNDMRSLFFGKEASTRQVRSSLAHRFAEYDHRDIDIRNAESVFGIFEEFGGSTRLVAHTAAQPSHDWAAREPSLDFAVNADATLTLLEATRKHCPDAAFIFTSTNKVYGDTPNSLPLVEMETRWELDSTHRYAELGIDEKMSVDQSTHSLFGVSKLSADLLVQEYGRYFGMNTGVFRCGCISGPNHAGARLHGFLSYLMKCAVKRIPYTIYGYKGKQVRDNLHSCDLVQAFHLYACSPRQGEVYNIGGGRRSNCSVRESIESCEQISGQKLQVQYVDAPRQGDHMWWISDTTKFTAHYPEWRVSRDVTQILSEIHRALTGGTAGVRKRIQSANTADET